MTFEYAPAPESRDVARLRASYGIFVDGEFRDGSGEAIKTINPATEEPLAEVAEASPADVEAAVAAARRAQRSWARMRAAERAKYIFRIARALLCRLASPASLFSAQPEHRFGHAGLRISL
jgi:aldehyde dehydrogenase (NAD+)